MRHSHPRSRNWKIVVDTGHVIYCIAEFWNAEAKTPSHTTDEIEVRWKALWDVRGSNVGNLSQILFQVQHYIWH